MPKPTMPHMPSMQNMLAYTIQSTLVSNWAPYVIVGFGSGHSNFKPQNPVDDSYWILILDATDPHNKVKDFVVPGSNNTKVPDGLDQYMTSPQYIFAIATQYLSMLHVPQGDFYDYLVKYGADRELQRLEQINSVLGCGSYSRVSYILTGQCGPRGVGATSYEVGSTRNSELMLMSLMPGPSGPPYAICNSFTFKTR
ncbi:MAG: hypothetical protein WAV20_16240 [Blastocatellia bacterium]